MSSTANRRQADATDRRRSVRVGLVVVGFVAAGLAGLAVVSQVPPTEASFYPKCQFHHLTGLHCPGCGTTRGLHALLNGRFEQAVAYNALMFVVLPVVGLSLVRSVWSWATGRGDRGRRRASRWPVWAGYGFVALMLVFWVLRNVPVYPFTLLAPHELSP